MGSKEPRKPEPRPIRVAIVGEHTWTGHSGVINPTPDKSGFEVISVLGGPPMFKVDLTTGQSCYAAAANLRKLSPPPSPAPPRKRGG